MSFNLFRLYTRDCEGLLKPLQYLVTPTNVSKEELQETFDLDNFQQKTKIIVEEAVLHYEGKDNGN